MVKTPLASHDYVKAVFSQERLMGVDDEDIRRGNLMEVLRLCI